MATLNELHYSSLHAQTGASQPVTLNELDHLWLDQNGIAPGTWNERYMALFLANGASPGTWNEMAYEFLGLLGWTGGTLNERWYEFWGRWRLNWHIGYDQSDFRWFM